MEDFDISKLFSNFDDPESLALVFFMVASFLLGFLVAYLLRSRRVRRLKKEIKAMRKKLDEAQIEIKELQTQLELKNADTQRLSRQINERDESINRLEIERKRLYNEAYQLREDVRHMETSNQEYISEVESGKLEIQQLKAKIELLQSSVNRQDEDTNNVAQMQSFLMATKRSFDNMEERLARVELENTRLKSLLDNNSSVSIVNTTAAEKSKETNLTETDVIDEDPEIQITSSKPLVNIPNLDLKDQPVDNLTLIDGIGPFLEKKLNETGIYTYEQIANIQSDQIPQLTRAIGHIPGRIERDNWVGQAKKLLEQRQPVFSTAIPKDADRAVDIPVINHNPEDLTIIEGIGPILESILKDAGIKNWQELADTDSEELKNILLSEGPAYQIIDPSSWPAQAKLALKGEWELLKEYREEVNGK